MSHAELIKLVATVNSGLALLTWPFVIYEVFSKSVPINTLKSNLDVRRGQLLLLVTLRIEQVLQPFWPKTTSRILVEPEYRIETPVIFSESARDAVKECLERAESLLSRAARVRTICRHILLLDQITYWLVYGVAAESALCLILWFFAGAMSDQVGLLAIGGPVFTALLAFLSAGGRQTYHYKAQREIAREDEIKNS
jgi:hypothetical protein